MRGCRCNVNTRKQNKKYAKNDDDIQWNEFFFKQEDKEIVTLNHKQTNKHTNDPLYNSMAFWFLAGWLVDLKIQTHLKKLIFYTQIWWIFSFFFQCVTHQPNKKKLWKNHWKILKKKLSVIIGYQMLKQNSKIRKFKKIQNSYPSFVRFDVRRHPNNCFEMKIISQTF